MSMAMLCVSLSSIAYDFESGGMMFSILSESEALCALERNKEKPYEGNFTVPDSIGVNGKRYQIYQINDSAFFKCENLLSITIPSTIKAIKNDVFNGCVNLNKVIIEDGTLQLSFGYTYFSGYKDDNGKYIKNPIKDLYIGRDLTYYKSTSTWYYPEYSPFAGIGTLENVIFGDYVTRIPNCLLACCGPFYVGSIKSLKFGNGNLYIGANAFYGSLNMSSLTIPSGVTGIGNNAFDGCMTLKELILPETLTSIGEDAFTACNNIISVTCFATNPPKAPYAFEDVTNVRLRVPAESIKEYKTKSGWNEFGEILAIDENANPYPKTFAITYLIPEAGIIKESIKEGQSRDIDIMPSEGYVIHSITLNDIEQQVTPDCCHIALSKVSEDQNLKIVYQLCDVTSSIGAPSSKPQSHKVLLYENRLEIQGEFTTATLYTIDGKVLYNGTDNFIYLTQSGILLLNVDGRSYKFLVNK